ncbi:MAG: hypothetical protein A3J76_00680 [Candidatus Moranbacteria bacterium RBG_13_45_13]|nr:MAG: hypothetical protein A3J76_00680 [Candidatus Moranbacteria bacterium RBG_13_45_13]
MNNKTKYIWAAIVIVALIFAGFLWYQGYAKKGKTLNEILNTKETANQDSAESLEGSLEGDLADESLVEDETDYNAICESGESVEIASQSGTLSSATGKLRKVYPDDPSSQFKNYLYYLEGTESLGITGDKLYKLDYFEDREVEIQGVKNDAKKEIAIAKLKCAGAETDKNLLESRKKLMNYLAANINSIAPQKAKYEKWTVDIVDFVDANNVYVEYYDAVEDNESSDVEDDTSRRVLLETAAKSGGGYDAKVLAYWEMGEDDYVLKTGTDKFEEVEEVASYQYDPEDKTWERID